MANNTISPVVTASVGVDTNILADLEDLVIYPVMMARYDEHDWDDESGRSAEFPAGALLGWRADGDRMQAWDASDQSNLTRANIPAPIYTWTPSPLNNRGNASAATIPASNDDNVLVLMHNVDISDYTSADDGYPIVKVAYSGTFRFILQDHESYGVQPWPTATPGGFYRIRLFPGDYSNVG